jgi:hypothetical protein
MLRAAALLALLAAPAAGPAAAQFLITESDAARYPAGEILDEDVVVSLAPRERIAFIGPDGVVREAVGRFVGRLSDLDALRRNTRDLRQGRDASGHEVRRPDATGRDASDGALAAGGDPAPPIAGGGPGGAGAPGLPGPDPADR